ncbi:hypothetical protein AVEN_104821-1, partial [Araneus ventricosus]
MISGAIQRGKPWHACLSRHQENHGTHFSGSVRRPGTFLWRRQEAWYAFSLEVSGKPWYTCVSLERQRGKPWYVSLSGVRKMWCHFSGPSGETMVRVSLEVSRKKPWCPSLERQGSCSTQTFLSLELQERRNHVAFLSRNVQESHGTLFYGERQEDHGADSGNQGAKTMERVSLQCQENHGTRYSPGSVRKIWYLAISLGSEPWCACSRVSGPWCLFYGGVRKTRVRIYLGVKENHVTRFLEASRKIMVRVSLEASRKNPWTRFSRAQENHSTHFSGGVRKTTALHVCHKSGKPWHDTSHGSVQERHGTRFSGRQENYDTLSMEASGKPVHFSGGVKKM